MSAPPIAPAMPSAPLTTPAGAAPIAPTLNTPDGMALVTGVVRAHQLLQQRIDAVLRPLDLTFARYEVLRLLAGAGNGALAMTRLGALLQVHPTSVTSAVDRLERQGFVTRMRPPDDRRVVLAAITTAGRMVLDGATTGLDRVVAAPGLAPERMSALTDLLGELRSGGLRAV